MAFKTAQKSRVLVGQVSFSGYTRSLNISEDVEALDVTTIADTAKTYIVGPNSGSFQCDMLLDTDTTANGQWDRATTWKSTPPVAVTYAPEGYAALAPVFLLNGIATQFTTTSSFAGPVEASISATPQDRVENGYSLEDLAAITIDTTGTARDLTASSDAGGVAQLHVTAYSGLTSDVITVQDSADGSTGWLTIATFTTVTGLTSERVAVTGTVRRYLRVVDDVTGTGSITRQVSFARR